MLNTYTFHYRLPPSITVTELTSIATEEGDLLFEDVRERDQLFYRRHCRTRFTAYGADFDTLDALRAVDTCDDIDFLIYESGIEVWAGKISLRRARWYPDQCRVEFTPELNDDYNCILQNWDEEFNILDIIGGDVTAKILTGTIETCDVSVLSVGDPDLAPYACSYGGGISTCTDCVAMTLVRHRVTSGVGGWDYVEDYAREVITLPCVGGSPSPPPGDGWTLVDNDCAGTGNATYARPVQVVYNTTLSSFTLGGAKDQIWDIFGDGDVTEFDNGKTLSAILGKLATSCGLTVKSDFFNINPPGTAPSNAAYTAAASDLSALVFWQKSDVKRANASDNATIGRISLRGMLETLAAMFQAYARVEGGTDLRIEHISYYDGSNGEDLTSTQPEAVTGFNDYTYDAETIPSREKFTWMDAVSDEDFRGKDIVYSDPCANSDAQEVSVSLVTTAVTDILSTPDSFTDSGFVVGACAVLSGTYYLIHSNGAISGDTKINGALSWANIHDNYYRWDRLLPSGTLNGGGVTFESSKRTRRQQTVLMVLSAADYFALDTTEKIKTGLGWGEIGKGTYSAGTCRYNIDLLHND